MSNNPSTPSRLVLPAALSLLLALVPAGGQSDCNSLTDLKVKNSAKSLGRGLYSCVVYVEASRSTLANIKTVSYTLHPSLPKPNQKIKSTRNRRYFNSDTFNASEEFYVKVKIEYRDGRKTDCVYGLKLFTNTQALRSPSRHHADVPDDSYLLPLTSAR